MYWHLNMLNSYYSGCDVYWRAAFILLSISNCAAFIQGGRLFEGSIFLRKYCQFITPYQSQRTILWQLIYRSEQWSWGRWSHQTPMRCLRTPRLAAPGARWAPTPLARSWSRMPGQRPTPESYWTDGKGEKAHIWKRWKDRQRDSNGGGLRGGE